MVPDSGVGGEIMTLSARHSRLRAKALGETLTAALEIGRQIVEEIYHDRPRAALRSAVKVSARLTKAKRALRAWVTR